tara:strand:- start:3304 stop:3987 length:684 start_codon:yes stop_codon:yes gene_type:complete
MNNFDYDISLYGHLVNDLVFEDFDRYQAVGGMGNVWNTLIQINSGLRINLQPTSIGNALILIDKLKLEKVVSAKLNLKTQNPVIYSSRCHHIMYLNRLDDISFIDNIKTGFISADITDNGSVDYDILKKIDYLFISKRNLWMDLDELSKIVKGWVILHYPTGSYTTNGVDSFEISLTPLRNLNILGAGDIFASNFLYKKMYEEDIKKCVTFSHNNTTKILKERIVEH